MKDSEISSREELEAALAGHAMSRSEALWKQAEGRNFRWTDVVVATAGGLSLLMGLLGITIEQDITGVMPIVVGVMLIVSVIFRHQQAQIDALRELLKKRD